MNAKSPLTQSETPTASWAFILRVIGKAGVLLIVCNLLFALIQPIAFIEQLSQYNTILPGRLRLPYGEDITKSYSLSLNSVPAMMQSHVLANPKEDDEFRVLLLGDSSVWGWFLNNEDALSEQINTLGLKTSDGRRIVVYNLGYPIMSLTKDLLLLEAGLGYEPDAVIWLVTLESFPYEQQLRPPLLHYNAERTQRLIATYNLNLDPQDPRFITPTFWQQTLFGQRREFADLLRYQLVGFSWMATGIDQSIPNEIPSRRVDFDPDLTWHDYEAPTSLTNDFLAQEILAAGIRMAENTPLLIVNEPTFISDGQNSHLRYNSYYPRWAYDDYRFWLQENVDNNEWNYIDLWNVIPPQHFSDGPIHLTPEGSQTLAAQLAPAILNMSEMPQDK